MMTTPNRRIFLLSIASKNMTLQHVCNNMKERAIREDVTMNTGESPPPRRPTLPGPTESAKIFIKENAPLIIPNPRPHTKNQIIIVSPVLQLKCFMYCNIITIGKNMFIIDESSIRLCNFF